MQQALLDRMTDRTDRTDRQLEQVRIRASYSSSANATSAGDLESTRQYLFELTRTCTEFEGTMLKALGAHPSFRSVLNTPQTIRPAGQWIAVGEVHSAQSMESVIQAIEMLLTRMARLREGAPASALWFAA